MIAYGTAAHGASRRRLVSAMGIDFRKAEWMDTGADPVLSPTVSLIEQPPDTVLGAHFHRQNQFQVFVDGGGSIGSTPLAPVTIHYAGAYTAYGPLAAGPQGIKYFTIRPVCESGALAVEQAREMMVRGPKRHATSATLALPGAGQLVRMPTMVREDVIPHAVDGLGASVLTAGAASDVHVPWAAGASGLFMVVLGGSLLAGNLELCPWENLYASGPSELPGLAAGEQGVAVACLFVPAKAEAYL